jgi:uroporphyrinogen decarboxylase
MNDLFIRACKKKPVERTPIWIMRQAGRYLPEYRKVREKTDFITMVKTPELAAEVTIQPVDILGVDAAIFFSDILVIPDAMGMKFEMEEGKGPSFNHPIKTDNDVKELKEIDPTKDLKYVLDGISLTLKELDKGVPLIGFSGSPWTLMTYMVEGKGSKNFSLVKQMIYNYPELAHTLLEKLTIAIADYLTAQIDSGVNAIQLFDTWGGILSQKDYLEFSLRYITEVINRIKRENEPVILYAKGIHHRLGSVAKSGADVLGVDWTLDLGKTRRAVEDKIALQGNLDPCVLYASEEKIKQEAKLVLDSYGKGNGHIFNLGHGILPDTDPEKVKALVKFVKEESKILHHIDIKTLSL